MPLVSEHRTVPYCVVHFRLPLLPLFGQMRRGLILPHMSRGFLHHPQIRDVHFYLASFVSYYNLMDHIRLSCRATHIRFDAASGRWAIIFQDLALGKRREASADFVVLCTGHELPEGGLHTNKHPQEVSGSTDGGGAAAGGASLVAMHANEAVAEQLSDLAAAPEITVMGDGEDAVECASALTLLRRGGHNLRLIMSTCGPTPHADIADAAGRVISGASLLEGARRRALHATLQPHPSLPPPGAVDRVLRAPTKRRFWAYVKSRAAAAAVSLGNGCSAAARGANVSTGIRTIHNSPALPAPAQPSRLVLWAPSFRDPRVMPFLEPGLRRALLLPSHGDSQPPPDQLVLYRSVVHPEVPGLAFVGWKAHAATPLLVLELQAQWLVALLTARLQLPQTADMYDDIARQRAWRAAALASPLMSSRGSLARKHDEHYVRQLLADLTGIVELRKEHWKPAAAAAAYLSERPLTRGQSPVAACDGRRRHGGLGGCFGAATADGEGALEPTEMQRTSYGLCKDDHPLQRPLFSDGCNGSGSSANIIAKRGFRVRMYIQSLPMAPYLQEKLRRAVQPPDIRVAQMSGHDGGGSGGRSERALSAPNNSIWTARQDGAAAEQDFTTSMRNRCRRHRVSASSMLCNVRQGQLLYPRFSDARGHDVDGGNSSTDAKVAHDSTSAVATAATAAAAAPALSSIVRISRGSTYVSGGRLSRGSGCGGGGEDTREADLSARLRRMSQSIGVDISTLVDIMTDDGGSVQYGSQVLLPLPPTVISGVMLKADGSASGGVGDCSGDGFQQRRRPLACHSRGDYSHITEAAGVLGEEVMYDTDRCNVAMVAGQHIEAAAHGTVPGGICMDTSDVSYGGVAAVDHASNAYLSYTAVLAERPGTTVSGVKFAVQAEASVFTDLPAVEMTLPSLPPPSPSLPRNISLDVKHQYSTTSNLSIRPRRPPPPFPPSTPCTPPPPSFQLPTQPAQPQYPSGGPGMGSEVFNTCDDVDVRLYNHISGNLNIRGYGNNCDKNNGDGDNGDGGGDSDGFADQENIILTLRPLVNASALHGNDHDGGDVIDGEDYCPEFSRSDHAGGGPTGDDRKLYSGVTLSCPASPHTAPLQPLQPPRDRQSWSPPVRPHLQPSAPWAQHAQMTTAAAVAAAAATAAATAGRNGATTAAPLARLSEPGASMLLMAPTPISASVLSYLERRSWWATPPWAPPSRQTSGVEAGQGINRSLHTLRDPRYTKWLRSAAASITTPESARRRESSPDGYSYNPGGFSYSPGGYSYSPGGYSYSYNAMDVNEALMEAARWSSSRLSPLQPPAAKSTAASAASTSRPLALWDEHLCRPLRSRRDTADGSGLSGSANLHRGETGQEVSELSVSGRAAAGADVVHGRHGSSAPNGVAPEMSGAAEFTVNDDTYAGVVGEGGGLGGTDSCSERGSVVVQRQQQQCNLAGRSGPLMADSHLRPAMIVRQEIQERQDQIVREISCWLKEALKHKAQTQAGRQAAGAGTSGVNTTSERPRPPFWHW
ncbi:hypothetical protein VaNZ11_008871 [Volvox africanus]|uniref:FAD/NAD(P)-binding domain-containing protein n=1 Tax=Volvox africanus TaxID=51714 RepID=A0ABQ5S5Z7_9CHLO|nr:hypothetical protein VaNZ11_008871 [Volvox africanus]